MTLRIHVIRTFWPHWGKFSGINQFIRYIDANQFEIHEYLTSSTDEDFPLKNPAIRNILRSCIQKQNMDWYQLNDLMAEIRAFFTCILMRVDIIHYLDGEHATQFLPYVFWSPIRRTKLVAMYHQPLDLLKKVTNKNIIRRLDAVIVVSPEQIPYFTEIIEPEKIHLILHGIDTTFYKPGNQSKDGGKFKCITVGHWLRDFKVVRAVAERLSRYNNIEFHIVSSSKVGPEEFDLEDLKNVILHKDTVDDEGLRELYQQSHLLFLPLIQSTANNTLLEGLSCGLPIVSTLLPSIEAYVSKEGTILIEKNDPDRFADTILYLYDNPSERQKMGIASRKRAEELDWRRIAPLYEAVYNQVINSS